MASDSDPLRGLQARWQVVLDSAQDAIISSDGRGVITLFNAAAERIFGYRAEEVIGRNVTVLMPPPYCDEHDGYVRSYQRSGEAKAIGRIRTVYGRRKSGEIFPIELSLGETRMEAEVVYTAVLRDVSGRERTERRLRAQYAVTRALTTSQSLREVTPRLLEAVAAVLECVVGEVWHVDAGGGALRWDGAWHAPSFDAGDFLAASRGTTMSLGGGLPGRVWAAAQPLWVADIARDPEFQRTSIAGRVGLRAAGAFPLWRANEVTGVMVLFKDEPCEPDSDTLEMLDAFGQQIGDFMERARAQEALRESEERFTKFMDHLPGVAFMKDIDGRYVYVNRTYEQVFGVTLDQVRGKTDDEVWPPDTARQFKENDRKVVAERAPLQTIEIVTHGDGPHEWLVSKFPVVDAMRTPVLVAGIAIDISARRQAEARVRELEQLAQQRQRLADIGAITAKIVHDLGNPLAGISMQAQLIARRARRLDNPAVLTAAEHIVSRVQHLDTMVREFLEFAREQRLVLTAVDLPRLLSEVIHLWRPVALGRKVAIAFELAAEPPPIVADEEKLRRVFDNLIKNAVEAIDLGPGSITVRLSVPSAEKVRVSIEDTGPGIPRDLEVFRLFETTKAFGTGLGLPIAQQIVLAHGGGIKVAQLRPNGTAFHIDLRVGGPSGRAYESTADR